MGLWCSLLGHTFDETDVEEQREDRGSEVVTVIRELERCSRCGAERVVSENKEVTSVVEADEVGVEGDDPAGHGEDGAATGEAGGTGVVDRSAAGSFTDEPLEGVGDPEEEDAEILTDEAEPREPGEWPDETADGSETAAGGTGDSGAADDILDAEPEAGAGDEGEFEPTGPSSTVPEGIYACPECGFTVDADSSFRAGDACPECQEGYLEERNR